MHGRLTSAPRVMLDPAQRRAAWRRLAEAAVTLGQRAVDTEGRELLEPRHFMHDLARTGGLRFPVDGDAATGVATAFVILARATLNAAIPARRLIAARALLAAGKAVDELLTDQATAASAVWRNRMGEGTD